MNDTELARHLFAARDAVLSVHEFEQKRLRRKPHPTELVEAAKAWAEKLLDAITVYPGPAKKPAGLGTMLQRASLTNGKAGPQHYAKLSITPAESILAIIEHLKEPLKIVLAFREAFPTEFADVKCMLPFVRVVNRPNGDYLFYRRQDCKPAWEVRLPDNPLSAAFMDAYRKAEAAYANFTKPSKTYHRDTAAPALAAAA